MQYEEQINSLELELQKLIKEAQNTLAYSIGSREERKSLRKILAEHVEKAEQLNDVILDLTKLDQYR